MESEWHCQMCPTLKAVTCMFVEFLKGDVDDHL